MDVASMLLAFPGALLILLLVVPHPRRHARILLTHRLHSCVVSQLPWVLTVQRCFNSPHLDMLAHLSANTVTVGFFITLLPTAYWLGFHDEALRLTIGLALTTYVNSGWKDYLCSPRPWFACGPALQKKLRVGEDTDEVEYGAPSMHTAVSLFMNIYATCLVWEHSPDIPQNTLLAMYAASIAWTCWIAWTRIYLGVHSPVDLALGATLATALLVFWWLLAPALMVVLRNSPATTCTVGLVLLLTAFRTYPRPQKHTTSYIPTVIFTSAAYGLMAGHAAPAAWVASAAAALPPHVLSSLRAFPQFIQILIGGIILFLYMSLCKPLLDSGLPLLLGLAPPRLRRLWQPPISLVGAVRSSAGGSEREPQVTAVAVRRVEFQASDEQQRQQLIGEVMELDGFVSISAGDGVDKLPVSKKQKGKVGKASVTAAATTPEAPRYGLRGGPAAALESPSLAPRRAGLRSGTKARRDAAASMDSSISGSSFLDSEPDSLGSSTFTATASALTSAGLCVPQVSEEELAAADVSLSKGLLEKHSRIAVAHHPVGEVHHVGVSPVADSDGILRKAGGYPWDAYIARNFLCYASTTVIVALYGRLLGEQSRSL